MPVIRSQAIFPYFTNLPKDVITNTMHWDWDDGLYSRDAVCDAIATRLDAFYTTIYPNPYSSNYVNYAAARVEMFVLSDPSPRVPEVRSMAITTTTNPTPIPPEVAVVLSYHAAPESGVDRRRLHNRIYLGGLGASCLVASTSSTFPSINGGFRTAIANAASALLDGNGLGIDWVQYSSATLIPDTREIVGGWIDNEADTQRRRGVGATARTSWS